MRALKALLLIIVAAALCAFLWELAQVLRDMRDAEKDLVGQLDKTLGDADAAMIAVQGIQRDTTRTEAELAGLLNATRHIALDEEKGQQRQLEAVQTLAVKSATLVDDADVAVKQFGSAAQQLGQVGPAVNADLGSVAADAHGLMLDSRLAVEAATSDLGNPAIADTMAAADKSAQNLAATTATAEHAMQTIDQTVSAEAKIILAPASKIKRAALFAASLAGHFLGL